MKKAVEAIIQAQEVMKAVSALTDNEVVISSINNTGAVQVYKGIEKIAKELDVQLSIAYDCESEAYPFKCSFLYGGAEFFQISKEVPEGIQMHIRNYGKDDPIGDAEEAQADERPYINCVLCGEQIYKRTEVCDGEDYYDTPDGEICQECISGWVDQFRKECI